MSMKSKNINHGHDFRAKGTEMDTEERRDHHQSWKSTPPTLVAKLVGTDWRGLLDHHTAPQNSKSNRPTVSNRGQ